MIALPKEIKSERLILRGWKDSDREPFHKMTSDPEVMEFFPKLLSRQESDQMIDRLNRHHQENGFTFWALEKKETGEFIGFTGLLVPNWTTHFTPCVEVGWRLARAHWGKGYATESAHASLKFGFEEAGLDEIVSLTVPLNKRSRAVMEKLGMQRNPSEDFDHPKIEQGHPLKRHVLYRLKRSKYQTIAASPQRK